MLCRLLSGGGRTPRKPVLEHTYAVQLPSWHHEQPIPQLRNLPVHKISRPRSREINYLPRGLSRLQNRSAGAMFGDLLANRTFSGAIAITRVALDYLPNACYLHGFAQYCFSGRLGSSSSE